MADGIESGTEPSPVQPRRARGLKSVFITPSSTKRLKIGRGEPIPLRGGLFRADIRDLTPEQRSIYILLLTWCWDLGKPLPNDLKFLSRICWTTKCRFKNVFLPVAENFFDISDDGWRPNAGHIDDPQSHRLPQPEWSVLKQKIFVRDDFSCSYCGTRGGILECDHIIPISRGGSNEPENLATACRKCNREKGDSTLEEWLGGAS